MDRREMLGFVGAGAAGLFATAGAAARANQQEHDHGQDDHIAVMARCARACAEAASHCLDQLKHGGSGEDAQKHAEALAFTAACEEFCILSAKQSACKSPLANLAHEANAQACDQCAKVCDEVEGDIMAKCAEACRECAEVCRQMARPTPSRA